MNRSAAWSAVMTRSAANQADLVIAMDQIADLVIAADPPFRTSRNTTRKSIYMRTNSMWENRFHEV